MTPQIQIPFTEMLNLAALIVIPLLVVFIAAHLQNRSDRKKMERQFFGEREEFRATLRNFPLHDHTEVRGALNKEGVRYAAEMRARNGG